MGVHAVRLIALPRCPMPGATSPSEPLRPLDRENLSAQHGPATSGSGSEARRRRNCRVQAQVHTATEVAELLE